MSAANVALRLARREVIRRPWRSLVVMLLVIVPVVALTGFAVMVRTMDRTPADAFEARWGSADIVVREAALAPSDPIAQLTADGTVTTVRSGTVRAMTTDDQREWIEVTDHVPFGPDWSMVMDDLDGRVPNGPDEVLISTELARELDLAVADRLALERPVDAEATVVGTARWRDDLDRLAVMVDAGAEGTLVDLVAELPERYVATATVIDLPASFEPQPELLAALEARWTENRFTDAGADDERAQLAIVWSWVGGTVAFVIVGVVITAAFAVTARRQLRLIGQLMGNGASDATLRWTLALQGSVVGLLGGIAGIGLALLALEVGQPVVERIVDRRIPSYDVRPGDLVPVLVLATLAATVAALIPARVAIRTSVLQALAGRRPVGPYPRRVVVWGATACVGGLALLAVATAGAVRDGRAGGDATWLFVLTGIAGALGVILGTCAMAPALIARLEPLAGRLTGTSRLAARSVARQRTRTGAVVAAVACVSAGAVAASTVWFTAVQEEASNFWSLPEELVSVTSYDSRTGRDLGRPTAESIAELLAVLPDAEVVPTRAARVPSDVGAQTSATDDGATRMVSGPLLVADAATLEALDLDPAVHDALRERGAVIGEWMDAFVEPMGTLPVVPGDPVLVDDQGRPTGLRLDAAVVDVRLLPQDLITEELATELGLSIEPAGTYLRSPAPLTQAQRDALRDIQEDGWIVQGGPVVSLSFDDPPWTPSTALVTTAILAVATAVALGVVGLGLALSAAETKDERDVLAVIGARPSTLRRLAATKALVLAATGTVIGVPLGFVPTWVVSAAADAGSYDPTTVVFPWIQVLLLVVAVPLVATAATHLASAVSLRARPVQASTMAFD
ncbi:FtsX-like permease family protein [Actinomarinicola tropica]|uniref:FtsX-like permease family protein n=1 Tax=Actinomarinicola tropica TaxID=2789776 RepID=A0A5Q2RA97_9ACTN|nr:FtsX-like permease family protein [Actinomarinicola tropica]QGG93748.1 FtsX-like permease family protein [Actinomarinicola tropica]